MGHFSGRFRGQPFGSRSFREGCHFPVCLQPPNTSARPLLRGCHGGFRPGLRRRRDFGDLDFIVRAEAVDRIDDQTFAAADALQYYDTAAEIATELDLTQLDLATIVHES